MICTGLDWTFCTQWRFPVTVKNSLLYIYFILYICVQAKKSISLYLIWPCATNSVVSTTIITQERRSARNQTAVKWVKWDSVTVLSNNCRCEASCCFYPSVFSAPSCSFDSNTDCLSLSSAEKTQSDFSVSWDPWTRQHSVRKVKICCIILNIYSKYRYFKYQSNSTISVILLPLSCLRAFASSLITLTISGFEYLSLWDGWDRNTQTQ